MSDPVVIVSIARTPMGSFQGELAPFSAPELGGYAIKAALQRAQLNNDDISEVIMGSVLTAGQGQAPARQAALSAGLSIHTPCSTLNKMCGSGMKAVMLAHDLLLAHPNNIIIAGGQESMTNTPYLLPDARKGMRIGHSKVLDHMLLDGLEDAYDKGKSMGYFAELTAQRYGFSREAQDEFAIRSVKRAQDAIKNGLFKNEIITIDNIDTDEGPSRAKIEKIPLLRPAFTSDGTVTAANSSSISDGAAAIVLMRKSQAHARNLKPLAKIIGHAQYAHEAAWFTTAPVGAIKKLLADIHWTINDVDLFEINEAFAVVAMAAIQDLKLSIDKVNIHGGACVLGHPIGASGARILVTLIAALQQHHLKRGIAALCIGGGEGSAIAVEIY